MERLFRFYVGVTHEWLPIFCFFGRGLESKHTWGGDRLAVARFNMAWLLEGEPKGEYQLPKVAEDQIFTTPRDSRSKQPRLDDQEKESPNASD